jgi:hypothetical protein
VLVGCFCVPPPWWKGHSFLTDEIAKLQLEFSKQALSAHEAASYRGFVRSGVPSASRPNMHGVESDAWNDC